MPLAAPPLCFFPERCCCFCSLRPAVHGVVMFQEELRSHWVGGCRAGVGVGAFAFASRVSPCRRRLAHLKRVHSVVVLRGPAWSCVVPAESRLPDPDGGPGPGNAVRRHVARPRPCHGCVEEGAAGERAASGRVRGAAMACRRAEEVQWRRIDVGGKC